MQKYIVENGELKLVEAAAIDGLKISVHAAGVNRADIFHLAGKYPSFGLEFAGELGGKRVAGLVDGGAYAQEIAAEQAAYVEIPEGVNFPEAASMVEALATAYHNLVELCALKAGEKVLVHGGGSGIGVVAIQLAKLLGAEVTATASNPEKLALIEQLGARAVDYTQSDFGDNEYDIVLDIVGASYFNQNLAALKNGGRLAIISFLGGAKGEVNLAPLLTKNLQVHGSTIRSLSLHEKQELLEKAQPFMPKIKPIIAHSFAFSELAEAIDYVGDYKNVGKVVIGFK